MADAVVADNASTQKFPAVFWTANVVELFERAAYYSMASFVVIYLGQLGFGSYWPSFLSSSVLWFLVFFLPILSGTIADQIGFRNGLLLAFVLLTIGYAMMGYPVWLGGSALSPTIGKAFTASSRDFWVILLGIVVIGIGASFVKPCISGTVQKTHAGRATLAFAIFYMLINIGSLFGRGTAFVVRNGAGVGTISAVVAVLGLAAFLILVLVRATTKSERTKADIWMATAGFTAMIVVSAAIVWKIYQATAAERAAVQAASLSYIFGVAAAASIVAFFAVLVFYREPSTTADPSKPRRSVGRILLDMVLVLGNGRFTMYLIVMTGFYFIYNQVYNVLPLYVKKVVEPSPAMDLYTAANPFVIVSFQLLISNIFGRMKPIRSMVAGTVIIAIAMLINVVPVYAAGGPRALVAHALPLGSVFIILTVGLIALGELFTSPRMYEYFGGLAPKGQEGLFLGYANLPLALGALLGGPVGAYIFNEIMAKGATTTPDGLLELVPANNVFGWAILMAIGLVSAASLWLFNRWVERQAPPRQG
jgi:proton-dependent oligopeptide transporter, POT family